MFPVCVMSAVIARLTHCPTGINFFAENCRAVDSIVVLLEAIILSSVSMILVLRCQLCFQTPARLPKLILWIAWATVTAVWLAKLRSGTFLYGRPASLIFKSLPTCARRKDALNSAGWAINMSFDLIIIITLLVLKNRSGNTATLHISQQNLLYSVSSKA